MLDKDWEYAEISEDELVISSYNGNGTIVVVPEKIGERKVVGISSLAFSPANPHISEKRCSKRSQIEEVVIPEGVKKIEAAAFDSCTSLRKITLPKSLEIIEEYCFYGCKNLEQIVTENTNIRIDCLTFMECDKLNKDELKFPTFIIENGILKEYINYKGETKITIPYGVTEIGSSAFQCCSRIESVIIPDGVIRIGDYAFADCYSLTSVVIPESVKEIDRNAFAETNLSTITIPKGVTEIKEQTFYKCSLESIVIPEGVIKIKEKAFSGCNFLKSVYLPDTITDICRGAFEETEIDKIKLPNGIKKIEKHTFSLSSISSLVIPDGVTTIGEWSFYSCYNLEELIIPDSVIEIGADAFCGCPNLKKLVIPKTMERMDRSIFENQDISVISNELIENWEGFEYIGNIILGFLEGCETGYGFSENVKRKNLEYIKKLDEDLRGKTQGRIFLIAEDETAYPVVKELRKWKYLSGECGNIDCKSIKGLSVEEISSVIETAKKSDLILIYGENCDLIKKRINDYDGVVITSSQLPDERKFIAVMQTLSFALEDNEISSVNAVVLKEFFHNVETIDIELRNLYRDNKENDLEPILTERDRVFFSDSYPVKLAQKITKIIHKSNLEKFKYYMCHQRDIEQPLIEARIILVKEKRRK